MLCSKCNNDNPADAMFCMKCGTKFENRCSFCNTVNPADAKFCRKCGASLGAAAPILPVTEPRNDLAGDRRHLTVLFCDLVGSTEIASHLDPEEWREIVAEYHRAAAQAIERFVRAESHPHEIPATLHDSLLARLDRLGPAKEVAQFGAVIGREFSYGLLHAVHPAPEGHLQAALEALSNAELLYVRGIPPEAVYGFRHALIQDAAYEALLKTRRWAGRMIAIPTFES